MLQHNLVLSSMLNLDEEEAKELDTTTAYHPKGVLQQGSSQLELSGGVSGTGLPSHTATTTSHNQEQMHWTTLRKGMVSPSGV